MKPSSLIGHATELYVAARTRPFPSDQVVRSFFRDRRYLGARDRREISDILYGLLRNTRLLECYLESLPTNSSQILSDKHSSKRSFLLYLVYAVKILRSPVGSVIEQTDSLWSERFPREEQKPFLLDIVQCQLPDDLDQDAIRRNAVLYSLPESLVAEWMQTYGEEEATRLCSAMNTQAPVCVRVNVAKVNVEECQRELESEGIESERPRYSPHALLLRKRISTAASPSFRNGLFEMQDEGSQLISFLSNPSQGSIVIDACAGSGGKALHLAALMNNDGRIIASDLSRPRLRTLRQRMQRAGATIVETANPDDHPGQADIVLIDAPCSGSGTFRRNPGSKLSFTRDRVLRNIRTQQSLLNRYAGLVKPGGRMIYATCSLVRAENEEMVEGFLRSNRSFSLVPADGVLRSQGIEIDLRSDFLELLPHRHSTDGFFGAVMVNGK